MCARVGNQRSRGVVTARVRTDAVRSLRHQCRDLHQSTYPCLSEDRDSSYYHWRPGEECDVVDRHLQCCSPCMCWLRTDGLAPATKY
jgi:hypothetical protein